MAHTTAFIDGLVDLQQPKPVRHRSSSPRSWSKQQNRHTIRTIQTLHAASDIRPVEGLHLFKLYNGHPSNNWGMTNFISVEELWDELLTDGMLICSMSSDDAHHFQDPSLERSNPGRGWVMARAKIAPMLLQIRFCEAIFMLPVE